VDPARRRLEMAERVARSGRCTVDELARAFDVSVETVRRDLSRLAADGFVQKIHGAAVHARLAEEGSFRERMAEDAAAKRAIAEALPAQVSPGETVFMDTGSTTLAAARALASVPQLTVITNSCAVAEALAPAPEGRVFLLGGAFRAANGQTVGPLTVEDVGRFRADAAILTVSGLDAEAGAMDADVEEAAVARAMIAAARRTIVLAASSKFGRRAGHLVCRHGGIDVLICDTAPTGGLAEVLHDRNVAIVAAGAPGPSARTA
jgi:DeoR family glycerol-3-phosphate regulon repressor